ncbi:MAG TPA: PSD1 and planctomycete cytochrome C domain-containing protein, partial [Gemmataceae bacterium]|nr:PSD1 and planctomycete cytochrome C domain-containing protein [Gemmataceae bacterium]
MRKLFLAISILIPAGTAHAADPGVEFFEAKIRPVLVDNCYQCHSTTAKKQKGGLHLDTRDAMRAGGDNGPAVTPGKPAESLLLKAVRQTDELKMPPKGKLSDAAIADLEKWIAMGAPDPRDVATAGRPIGIEEGRKFWSFQPLHRPAVPVVRTRYSVLGPIDRFVLAKLGEKGIAPNPPADRRTLIRRVYFDLLGLPPTPEEVTAFVNDPDRDAYPKLIDKLLASPHYGERWGRHWLDLARFAESSGYEHDNDRSHAHQYRDFVIQALNRDVPFDKFVRWQIAGDELEPENPLAVKATGFLAAGPMNGQVTEREAEPARYEVFDDWVSTIGTTFLGLTVGCARCHDHKYDPIPSRDYYNLAANFTKAVRANINVPREGCRREDSVETTGARRPPGWLTLDATEVKARGSYVSDHRLTRQPDGSYLFTRVNGEATTIEFVAHTSLIDLTAVRIEALTDESLPNHGPGLGDDGNFSLSGASLIAGPADGSAKPQPVKLKLVRSTTGAKGGGWTVDRSHAGQDQAALYTVEKPINFPGGSILRFQLSCPGDSPSARQTIGKFRISVCAGEVPDGFDLPPRKPPPPCDVAFVVTEKVPPYRMMVQGPDVFPKTFVLKRGDVEKKDGEAVPGVLQVLSRSRLRLSGPPRSALAQWLTDVDDGAGALVARVIVNRLWQHHMGRGIVGTPSDFGAQGDRPTHPELLDWLACELIEKGWSLKAIHREILISATYQQSSAREPKSAAIDPDDHLYWRHPLTRLEAEAIRDALLAVSGRLDGRQFGPGTL